MNFCQKLVQILFIVEKLGKKLTPLDQINQQKIRIPCLYDSGLQITENTEKANIFKEILKKRFFGENEGNSMVILHKRHKKIF